MEYRGKTKRIKIKLIIIGVIITALIAASVILSLILKIEYSLLLLVILPFMYLSMKQYQKLKRIKLIILLRKKWGVAEIKKRNFAEIDAHFRKAQAGNNKYILDDRTWKDLDMDLIYGKIDRTMTIPGEQVLYSILRQLLFSENELDERNCLIKLFSKNQDVRESYQAVLSKLGKEGGKYLIDMLCGDRPSKNKYAPLYGFMLILIPIFILLGILNYSLAWFGLILTLFCNMIIHFLTRRKVYEYLASLRYLGKLISCANKLTEIKHPVLERHHKEIEQPLIEVTNITKKTRLLAGGGDNFIYEYINIIFLIEVRSFYSVLRAIEKHEKHLMQIFNKIGFIDAMISVASYRAGLNNFVEPKFMNSGFFLEIEEVVHPLINEPVPNSISLESGGVLITGSNMSGKTTFLKAVGVNAILAQTINTCLAKTYQSRFFNIITLIGREDNIIQGKSYYLDEILALLRIINLPNNQVSSLCLLDEILQGTNSDERISASVEILLYLVKHNYCVLATTHDLEVTKLVNSWYCNYHFQEEIGEEGIVFNYKLLEGPSTTRNAVKLLRHVGYPEEISNAASLRLKKTTEHNLEKK